MSFKEKGSAHIGLLVALFALIFAASIIPVKRSYNDGKSNVQGTFIAKGDDSSGGDSSGGGDSGSRDSGSSDKGSSSGDSGSGSGNSKNSGNDSSSFVKSLIPKSTISNPKPENSKREVETKETGKNMTVETKTTPERIRNEIRQGNLRVRFEIENGKVKIRTQVKSGGVETELENEAENEAVDEVEAELEKKDIRIATAPGQVALVNKRAGALTNFPLSVDPTTRALTVTTPAGVKVVTVLPQQAVDNMLAGHVMDDVSSEKVDNSLASVPDLVQLETENGVLGYKIKGSKTHKLLGFIPIKTAVEAFVSAENGQVVQSKTSLLGRILNKIAP